MARPNRGYRLSDKPNKHGFYDIIWSENGRTRARSTGCKSLAHAQEVLANFILGKDRVKRGEGPTIAACLAAYWLEHLQHKPSAEVGFYNLKRIAEYFCDFRSEHTAKEAVAYFEILATQPGRAPADITAYHSRNYFYERVAAPGWSGLPRGKPRASAGGIRRELSALNAALRYAVKMQRLPAADLPHIQMPEEPPPRDRWLTDEEIKRLLNAAHKENSRAWYFIQLALGTGARRGALETLTWKQVDFENRIIYLNPDGRKQTKKRRATVPISDKLFEILAAVSDYPGGRYVLGHPGSIRQAFETAVKRAGLEGVTPHTLRHTWATRAIQNGVPPWKVAAVLGDTLQTVMKRYAHHCPEDLRDAVNRGPMAAMSDLSKGVS